MDYGHIILVAILITIVLIYNNHLKKKESERQKLALSNIRLISDNSKLKADQLKFQLQPHTINNILANLKAIANKLNRGMDLFSNVLEYILYKGNAHFVSIEEELSFMKNYLILNDTFISEIDAIKVFDNDVNKKSKYYSTNCIPHLITAYLIENAFKHGDINHPEFLKIYLMLNENSFQIVVTNKIKSIRYSGNSGLGLENMNKRLELLMNGKYEIESSSNDEEYIATLKIRFYNV